MRAPEIGKGKEVESHMADRASADRAALHTARHPDRPQQCRSTQKCRRAARQRRALRGQKGEVPEREGGERQADGRKVRPVRERAAPEDLLQRATAPAVGDAFCGPQRTG